MSATAARQREQARESQARRRSTSRGRRTVVALAAAAASAGIALTAVTVGSSDERPTTRPVIEQPGIPPAVSPPMAPWQDVFAGCLNDLECEGDASQRPAVRPADDLPRTASAD